MPDHRVPPPSPLYLGPAAHTSSGSNQPVERVVIHMTVSPCVAGGARATARYFNSAAAAGSAHYIVDPAEVIQDVHDSVIAWHAPPNPRSLGIELCGYPSSTSDAAWMVPHDQRHGTVPLWRWLQRDHRRMLNLAAELTAQLCLAYDVPIVFLTARDLVAGKHGITTHANVSAAWHQSTHWDPGLWPKRLFMARVRRHAVRLQKAAAA